MAKVFALRGKSGRREDQRKFRPAHISERMAQWFRNNLAQLTSILGAGALTLKKNEWLLSVKSHRSATEGGKMAEGQINSTRSWALVPLRGMCVVIALITSGSALAA